jgi:hypothetical protein
LFRLAATAATRHHYYVTVLEPALYVKILGVLGTLFPQQSVRWQWSRPRL